MRGGSYSDTALLVAQSILMSKYNQQYSEIKDIPMKTVIFLLQLYNAEAEYEAAESKKLMSKIKR